MREKTFSRKTPKTLLTTFGRRVRLWLPALSPGGTRSSWNGAPSGTAWLQANGRIGEGLTEREEIQSPRNPIAPRTYSLTLLLVHPTVCRSTLVTLKYGECHWPLRKRVNRFRQNKYIKTRAHSAATLLLLLLLLLLLGYLDSESRAIATGSRRPACI